MLAAPVSAAMSGSTPVPSGSSTSMSPLAALVSPVRAGVGHHRCSRCPALPWDHLIRAVAVATHLWSRWEPHMDDMSCVKLVSQTGCYGRIAGLSEMDWGCTIQLQQFGRGGLGGVKDPHQDGRVETTKLLKSAN